MCLSQVWMSSVKGHLFVCLCVQYVLGRWGKGYDDEKNNPLDKL